VNKVFDKNVLYAEADHELCNDSKWIPNEGGEQKKDKDEGPLSNSSKRRKLK